MPWLFSLGISMSWFFSLGILMSWLFVIWKNVLESRCYGLFVSVSRYRGVLVPESRCRSFLVLESLCRRFWVLESWCRGLLVLESDVPPRPRFRYHRENKKVTHNYVNDVAEKCFSCPNLCNIYLLKECISKLE